MTSNDMRVLSYENPGPRVEPIVRKAGENDDAPALSRAVADLGSQGWEMISPGSLVISRRPSYPTTAEATRCSCISTAGHDLR
jgi:hypothetical protein